MTAAVNRPIGVFISYSRADSAAIDRLEAELIGYGFHTWVDRSRIEGGDKWAAHIEQAIEASDIIVVGLSPDSVESFWVISEMFYAHRRKKPIIPILLRPTERIPLLLASVHYIDMWADESQGLQQLRLRLLRLDEQTAIMTTAPSDSATISPVTGRIAPTADRRINDPAARLVTLPRPARPEVLDVLFLQSMKAKAHGDLDQAEALLWQVVKQDAGFRKGVATRELAAIQRQLLPSQLDRLRRQATRAEHLGAWGEAIGAWQAFLDRVPDSDEAQTALGHDEQNQDASWLYEIARALAEELDWPTFHEIWRLLGEQAPHYGDPNGIHPDSIKHSGPASTLSDNTHPNRGEREDFQGESTFPNGRDRTTTQPIVTQPDNDSSMGIELDSMTTDVAPLDAEYAKVKIEIPRGTLLATCRGHLDTVEGVTWSSDGLRLATVGDDNTARIWDAGTGASLIVCAGHTSRYVKSVDWEPNGSRIATACWDEFVRIWDAVSGAHIASYRLDRHLLDDFRLGYLESVAWSPDSSRLAASGFDDTVRIWDTVSGKQAVSCAGHRAAVNSVAWSPDGTRIATASTDTTARVWDAKTGESMLTLRHSSRVMSVAWAPDGQRLVTGSYDAALQVWTTMTGELLFTSHHSYSPILSVAWSPDSARLATAGWDEIVRLWSAATGELLLTCQGHTSRVHCVAWSPDSQRIATASADKTACVWRV